MKPIVHIIKIGGSLIDDEGKLLDLLKQFAHLPLRDENQHPIHKLLIHGGGKLATRLGEQLGIPQQMVDGRRITDAETLKIVTMVYAGYVNKNIVATLQSFHCNAMGLCGADGDLILAHKRTHSLLDYGWVGDVDAVNVKLLDHLLNQQITPVIAPITHDQQGHLLNTNADTIAQALAVALCAHYEVKLIYVFEKEGVLQDIDNEQSIISVIDPASYQTLKATKKIVAGMIPKLDNAFVALEAGVTAVTIGNATSLSALINGEKGTTLTHASR